MQLRHPKTISEAVAFVVAELTDETKAEIRGQNKEGFRIGANLVMGANIRQSMCYRNHFKELLKADYIKVTGKTSDTPTHADSISGVILAGVWEKLNEK